MTHLKGIIVELLTDTVYESDSDDRLYIGLIGRGGGREFPIDIDKFNDYEKGTFVKYKIGDVWDQVESQGSRDVIYSQMGKILPQEKENSPSFYRIELDLIDYVYIRKLEYRKTDTEDQYRWEEVKAILYGGAAPIKRTFHATYDLWFGKDYGIYGFLPEVVNG